MRIIVRAHDIGRGLAQNAELTVQDIARAEGVSSAYWGPMAYAIMGGLLVATVLTLIFLPSLYVVWFGGKETPVAVILDDQTSPIRSDGPLRSRQEN